MGSQDVLAGLLMEMRRGTIVLCVLAQLEEPRYGYHLVTTLAQSGIPVEANTLYPLLRRLEGQGLLHSTWQAEGAERPRKYYQMTDTGREIFAALRHQWQETAGSVETLLGGGTE